MVENITKFALETLPFHIIHLICQILVENGSLQDILNLRLACNSLNLAISELPLRLTQILHLPVDLSKLSLRLHFMLNNTNWLIRRFQLRRQKSLAGSHALTKGHDVGDLLRRYEAMMCQNKITIQLDASVCNEYPHIVEFFCQNQNLWSEIHLNLFYSARETIESKILHSVRLIENMSIQALTQLYPSCQDSLNVLKGLVCMSLRPVVVPALAQLNKLQIEHFDATLLDLNVKYTSPKYPRLDYLQFKTQQSAILRNSRIREGALCDIAALAHILQHAPNLRVLSLALNWNSLRAHGELYNRKLQLPLPEKCWTLKVTSDTFENIEVPKCVDCLCLYDMYSSEAILEWVEKRPLKILNIVTSHWTELLSTESLREMGFKIAEKNPTIEVLSLRKGKNHEPNAAVTWKREESKSAEEQREREKKWSLHGALKLVIIDEQVEFCSPMLNLALLRRVDKMDAEYGWLIRRQFQI